MHKEEFLERIDAANSSFNPIDDEAGFLGAVVGKDRVRDLARERLQVQLDRLKGAMARVNQMASAGTISDMAPQAAGLAGGAKAVYRMPVDLHHALHEQFGPNCLNDASFRREFEREFPGCVVKREKNMATVSMAGLPILNGGRQQVARPILTGGIIAG